MQPTLSIGAADVLHEHLADHTMRPLGRAIYMERDRDLVWIIEFPRLVDPDDPAGPRSKYMRGPQIHKLSDIERSISDLKISTTTYSSTGAALLSEEELSGQKLLPPGFNFKRSNLKKWKAHRDAAFELIEPIALIPLSKLLGQNQYSCVINQRIAELGGQKFKKKVYSAVNAYLLGGWSDKSILLPQWSRCGGVGKAKFAQGGTGRPNKGFLAGTENSANYNCTEFDRKILMRGWQKFKTEGVSVVTAYDLTMNTYYAQDIAYLSNGKVQVTLRAPHERPTIAQFEYHGTHREPAKKAARINSARTFDRDERGLRGTTRDGKRALGDLVIDATSCDQTPVSEANRNIVLSSMWETRVIEPITKYRYGSHVSFEKSSFKTALMAIRNAILPKEPQCAPYFELSSARDWLSISPKQMLGDNGELKQEISFSTLSCSEIIMEFTRSYGAEHKVVEPDHFSVHRRLNHRLPGSTMGRIRGRGDVNPEKFSCLNFSEYMRLHIIDTLYWNNEIIVPELLTMEMRNDGLTVENITRQKAVEWYTVNGYIQSEPSNISQILIATLPQLQGTMMEDGVHLFDPRCGNSKLIKHLIYRSDYLIESGWLIKARKKNIPVSIYIDPMYLGMCWIRIDNELRELGLCSQDPILSTMTLSDWLQIQDADNLVLFLNRGSRDDKRASHTATIFHQAGMAAQAKADQGKIAQPQSSMINLTNSQKKREATKKEIEQQRLNLLHVSSISTAVETIEEIITDFSDIWSTDDYQVDDYMNHIPG